MRLVHKPEKVAYTLASIGQDRTPKERYNLPFGARVRLFPTRQMDFLSI